MEPRAGHEDRSIGSPDRFHPPRRKGARVQRVRRHRDLRGRATRSEDCRMSRWPSPPADTENPTLLARRFSPKSNAIIGGLPENRDELQVLIATDVLSEGQNLQDAAIIVNYDLPWTIIRLIQRAGRVDRVGQLSAEVASTASSHRLASRASSRSARGLGSVLPRTLRSSAATSSSLTTTSLPTTFAAYSTAVRASTTRGEEDVDWGIAGARRLGGGKRRPPAAGYITPRRRLFDPSPPQCR